MVWRVVTGPVTEPVTLAQAKAQCRVTHNLEDALISALIVAARQHIELTCNRAILPQQWEVVLAGFCTREIPLPGGHVREVVSVEVNGEAFEDYYERLVEPCVIAPISAWPTITPRPDAVKIVIDVGWTEPPQPIIQAMLMLIAHWYNHRETVISGATAMPMPMAVESLLFPYRDMRLI